MHDNSTTLLWAATDAGLVRFDVEYYRATILREADQMRCVAIDPRDAETIYVGSPGGAWKSSNNGETWRDMDLPESNVFSLAVSPADGTVYAGTEPSRLFKSTDEGETWHEMEALRRLPSAPNWSFPPRPWTSHVRWIAPNPADANLLLVGIELGGVMRSLDGGESWEDHRPGAQKDCHALAWHPVDTQRAYEAGGGGAAWSRDGGASWEARDEGRDRHYTWALEVDPEDPDRWFVSASPGPGQAHSKGDAQALIYRWQDGGPWEKVGAGLPQPLSSMPYVLRFGGPQDRRLFAGLRDGRLFASGNRGETWTQLPVEGATLKGMRAMQHAP